MTDPSEAHLKGVDLSKTNLREVDLRRLDLRRADLSYADLTVIDTITSKVVLILGRFTPERKPFSTLYGTNFSNMTVFPFCSTSRNLRVVISLRLFLHWHIWHLS
jgi:uncharacterized protein YjbI with pentapeptide repeats